MTNFCLKVPKVYDWITKQSVVHVCIDLVKCYSFKDKLSGEFIVKPSQGLSRIWKADGNGPITGTVSINYERGSGESLEVIINSEYAFSVGKGEVRSQTVDSLQSIEVRSSAERGECVGNFNLSVNYKLKEFCLPDKDHSVQCYLADSCGTKISSYSSMAIECMEINSKKRKNKMITTPEGKMTLQIVKLKKKGYLVVEYKSKGKLCKELFPFELKENVLMCAPSQARVECNIMHLECIPLVHQNDSCAWIDISINICQKIETKSDEVVTLKGEVCKPRIGLSLHSI